ncbi:hypothetical protein [Phenylobacterium sp.]|uniref:hypothetical protein n=1 Tax=Phenylobacterium sp. TaxID=1871053 RepID=UPI00273183DF|nr:hypothetical protein [Phenylobacterium sp.]MDP1618155.1 hypothetical protein [Phenylobacterium sp.]MDP1988255.1 hypothetical protein [Phenylobacterium sp.]
MSAKVPPEVTGVWRRELITAPGGYRDDSTRVFWVQADSWYGDIRLRIDIPRRAGATGFADFSDAELIELAKAQGFAGQLTVTPEMCAWRRDLDYQPPGPIPDEGTWRIEGDILIEGGIHAEYEEIWRLEPQSQGLRAAFGLGEAQGLLVIAGDHFLMMQARKAPLPAGDSLPALVESALAAGDRARAVALLDMPICYGRIGRDWRVVHSTLPWLEDRPLWARPPHFDSEAGQLLDGGPTPWTLLEVHDPDEELPGLFALATVAGSSL